jgi:ribosomal protein L44E
VKTKEKEVSYTCLRQPCLRQAGLAGYGSQGKPAQERQDSWNERENLPARCSSRLMKNAF